MRSSKSFLLAGLLAALPARAARPCKALGIGDYVKAYLNCQGNTRLLACAGLAGAATAGVATPLARKLITQQSTSPLIQLTAANDQWRAGRVLGKPKERLDELTHELAVNNDERARAESAALARAITRAEGEHLRVFAPDIRTIDGKPFDLANTPVREWPKTLIEAAKARQKMINEALKSYVARGQALTEQIIAKTAAAADESFPQLPTRSAEPFVRGAIARVEADELERVAQSSVAQILKRMAVASAPRVLGSLAGVMVAGPAMLAGQLAGASTFGCADAYSIYVNQDPAHECRLDPKINANVVQFLDRPESEQQQIFDRYPEVCTFYEKLGQKLFAFAKDESLSCQSIGVDRRRVILKASIDGQAREYQTDLREDGTVAAVRVAGDQGPKGLFTFVNDVNELKTPAVPAGEAWEEFRQLKMILPDALNCCASPNPICLRNYTRPRGEERTLPAPSSTTAS